MFPWPRQRLGGIDFRSIAYLGNSFMAAQPDVIAIIDDDSGMRVGLRNMLSSFGYRTELYASAEEFIDIAMKSEASCLVVDVQLGEISGLELARYLSNFGLAFPVIFMSGSDDENLRRQGLGLGCVAYLRKPFSTDRLMEAIVKAIKANPR